MALPSGRIFAGALIALLSACATHASKDSHVALPPYLASDEVITLALAPSYSKPERDRWIDAHLMRIDSAYYSYEEDLQKNRANLNIWTSVAALLFNSASSLTTSAGVKANYVVANSLATGTNTIVSREQFLEQTVWTLISAMRARREAAFAKIRIGMTKPESEYLLSEAHRDLLAYRAAGTLQQGMKFVLEKTEAAAQVEIKDAEEDIQDAVAYTDDERQLVYCISESLDALRPDQLVALRQVAKSHNVDVADEDDLAIARNKLSARMANDAPRHQRDLYALMEKNAVLLDPCPRY